jgi:flagellar basal-body rod modification protein FlgD
MTPTATLPTAAATAPQPPSSQPSSQRAKMGLSSDFDTFLQMLTAQIKNQDPLAPMKSEEFAAQLATFSGVEQQVYTNQLLEGLSARMGQGDLSQMARWVGMDARAQMPVWFDGRPVAVDPEIPVAGTRHQLVVTDAAGAEIDRRSISGDGSALFWDGRTTDGGAASVGVYRFSVESFDKADLVATEPVEAYGRVVEARAGRDGALLVFQGGTTVPAASVTALRAALAPMSAEMGAV